MKKFFMYLALAFFSTTLCAAEPIFIDNYEEAIKQERVLVVFGTSWCSHCVDLKRDMNDNKLNLDNYVVCVVDASKRKDLAGKYKVKSYPTSLIIKKEEESARKIGYSKKDFQKWIDENR